MINRRNRNRAAISEIAGTFLSRGVDACMAPFTDNPVLLDGIRDAEDALGRCKIDHPERCPSGLWSQS